MAPTQLSQGSDWTAVYRFYDYGHNLLYVGVTQDINIRFHAHGYRSRGICRYDIVWYPSRSEALAVEAEAIATLRPPWNAAGQPAIIVDSPDGSLTAPEIVRYLAERICSGAYSEGGRLPSISECCRIFRAGATTIKHALSMLRDQGLVEGRQGRGTFVTPKARWRVGAMSGDQIAA